MDDQTMKTAVRLADEIKNANQKLHDLLVYQEPRHMSVLVSNCIHVTPGEDFLPVLHTLLVDYWSVRLQDLQLQYDNL